MMTLAQDDGVLSQRLAADLADAEARFSAELLSDLPCVNRLVEYVERYRGKMLRPTLVLLSGMATEKAPRGDGEAHAIVAAVVEMIHMATLVHDDVLDDAEVRRGGVTVNELEGNETAVMLGDYLISHAYHLCSSLNQPWVSQTIAEATNTVCEGELLQLSNRRNWDLDERTYFEIIRRKTASLCGTCCQLGAALHDPPEGGPYGPHLFDYGQKLGVAFQIVDDVLDLLGREETVGKSLGRDLQKGKLTLPLIHFMREASPPRRRRLLDICETLDARDPAEYAALLDEARQMVVEQGSIPYAREWAGRLVDQAKARLAGLSDTPVRRLMARMADAVLTRQS